MKAIFKFTYHQNEIIEIPPIVDNFNDAYIYRKTGKEQTQIYLKDITHIEGLKGYVKVHTLIKIFVASKRLSYMEQKLSKNQFSRIHKSFIVSIIKQLITCPDILQLEIHLYLLKEYIKMSF